MFPTSIEISVANKHQSFQREAARMRPLNTLQRQGSNQERYFQKFTNRIGSWLHGGQSRLSHRFAPKRQSA
jgi:hypothetical protein